MGQNGVDISNLTLSGDQAGGLELSRDTDSKVHNITTADEPNGVFLHVNSTNVVLDAITLTGGRTGILEEKTTTGLHVTGSTIDDAHVSGMEIGGHATLLDGLTVKNSRAAIRVERGADGVTADRVSLIGGTDGLVTSGGTSGVVVKDLSTDGVGNDTLRSLSPGMQITGGTDPRRQHRNGPAGRDHGHRHPDRADLHRHPGPGDRPDHARRREGRRRLGRRRRPAGQRVTLRNSTVHALEAVRGTLTLLGTNDLSLPPLNLLGAIGLPLIGLALLLEFLHLLRQRRFGPTHRSLPPPVAAGAGLSTG